MGKEGTAAGLAAEKAAPRFELTLSGKNGRERQMLNALCIHYTAAYRRPDRRGAEATGAAGRRGGGAAEHPRGDGLRRVEAAI